MQFNEWKADLLRRAPRSHYPDPQPVSFDQAITRTDVLWLRAHGITPYIPVSHQLTAAE